MLIFDIRCATPTVGGPSGSSCFPGLRISTLVSGEKVRLVGFQFRHTWKGSGFLAEIGHIRAIAGKIGPDSAEITASVVETGPSLIRSGGRSRS